MFEESSPPDRTARPTPVLPGVRRLIGRCGDSGLLGLFRIGARGSVRPAAPVEVPEELFGWRAPRSWQGVALVLRGHTSGPGRSSEHVTVGALALRGAAGRPPVTASWADLPGELIVEPDEPVGLVPDACRRAVGLASHPAVPAISELINVEWLTETLHVAADPTTGPLIADWDALAALHPAWSVGPADDAAQLSMRLGQLVDSMSWEQLRASAATTGAYGLTADEVDWMDAPMFARWALGSHRAASDLIEDLSLFLPAHQLGALCSVVLNA